MNFNYIITEKKYLSKEQKEQLSWYCYADGQIWSCFNNYKGIVTLAIDEDFKIVGWSFTFLYPEDDIKTFYTYVGKKYRRMGIGSMLYKINSKMVDDNLLVSKHDRKSKLFYKSLGI